MKNQQFEEEREPRWNILCSNPDQDRKVPAEIFTSDHLEEEKDDEPRWNILCSNPGSTLNQDRKIPAETFTSEEHSKDRQHLAPIETHVAKHISSNVVLQMKSEKVHSTATTEDLLNQYEEDEEEDDPPSWNIFNPQKTTSPSHVVASGLMDVSNNVCHASRTSVVPLGDESANDVLLGLTGDIPIVSPPLSNSDSSEDQVIRSSGDRRRHSRDRSLLLDSPQSPPTNRSTSIVSRNNTNRSPDDDFNAFHPSSEEEDEDDDEWVCSLCTHLNSIRLEICPLCDTPRPSSLNQHEPHHDARGK